MEKSEVLRFVQKHRLMYAEVSAKTSEGISSAFQGLIDKIYSLPDIWLEDGLTEAGLKKIELQRSESAAAKSWKCCDSGSA